MGNCNSSSSLSSLSSLSPSPSNNTTNSLSSLSTSQQNALLKSLSTVLHQALQGCLSTHTLVLQYHQFTPEIILGIRITLAQLQQEQTVSQPALIHSLTIFHCFLNDIQTIQALCDWIASLQQLQELVFVRNTLQGRQQQLQTEHLDLLVQAIRRARALRPGRPLLHKLVVGNEFLTTDGSDSALRALCTETTALHVKCLVPEVNATTSLVRQPHFLQGFLEQGLSNYGKCQIQSLKLEGHGLLNAERWQTLARALTASTAVDHQGRRRSTSTLRHLQIVNNWIMVDAMITLIGPASPLETLDIDECTTFGGQISRAQAQQWGDALAQNCRLQVLCLRNLCWTDTLAVPTFLALRDNTTLHTLDVGIWDNSTNETRSTAFPPGAYRALAEVLPHLTSLHNLHLDLEFFFSFHSAELTRCMIRAMQQNTSLVEWMGGKKLGRRRFGPFHDVLLSTCIPRNRAWRAVQRLLSTEPPLPLSVWHAAVRHWLASPQNNRTALFCVIRRIKGESPP